MITWFEKLVGKENVSDEIVDREAYSTDGSRINGNATKIIWPTTTKQVHNIILYAKRNKIDIVPRGAGTNLVGSVVPFNSIVIDFSKMNKISVGRDFAIVEPGATLGDLNRRAKGRFFPIQPEDAETCTIGGMCGINSTGLYERKYGRMRDWVVEVEMIDGNGRLKKYGSEVIGMEGIIGIITKIKLKLADPIIEKSLTVFKFQQIQDVASKIASLRLEKNAIAIEFISASAAVLAGLEAIHHIIVEYDNVEGKVKGDDADRILGIRKNIFNKLADRGFVYIEDATLPTENLTELIHWLEKKGIPSFGSVGSGYLFPCFDERDDIKEFYEQLRNLGGRVGEVFGYGLLKKDFVKLGVKQDLKALKEEFDPLGILNKGKVI